MKLIPYIVVITLLMTFSSCSMDPAEMNARGARNAQWAKDLHNKRMAKDAESQRNRTGGSQRYGETLDETRQRHYRETNRISGETSNPYIRRYDN